MPTSPWIPSVTGLRQPRLFCNCFLDPLVSSCHPRREMETDPTPPPQISNLSCFTETRLLLPSDGGQKGLLELISSASQDNLNTNSLKNKESYRFHEYTLGIYIITKWFWKIYLVHYTLQKNLADFLFLQNAVLFLRCCVLWNSINKYTFTGTVTKLSNFPSAHASRTLRPYINRSP